MGTYQGKPFKSLFKEDVHKIIAQLYNEGDYIDINYTIHESFLNLHERERIILLQDLVNTGAVEVVKEYDIDLDDYYNTTTIRLTDIVIALIKKYGTYERCEKAIKWAHWKKDNWSKFTKYATIFAKSITTAERLLNAVSIGVVIMLSLSLKDKEQMIEDINKKQYEILSRLDSVVSIQEVHKSQTNSLPKSGSQSNKQ